MPTHCQVTFCICYLPSYNNPTARSLVIYEILWQHTHVSFFRPPKPGMWVGTVSVASGVSPRLDSHKNCLSLCSTKETCCSILEVVGSKQSYSRQLCPKSFTKNKTPSCSDGWAHVSLLPSLVGSSVREWETFADVLCWGKLPAGCRAPWRQNLAGAHCPGWSGAVLTGSLSICLLLLTRKK